MSSDRPVITWVYNKYFEPCGSWQGMFLDKYLYLVCYHNDGCWLFYHPGGGKELEVVTPGDPCKPTKANLKEQFRALAGVAEVHFKDIVQPALEAAWAAMKAIGPNTKKRYRSIGHLTTGVTGAGTPKRTTMNISVRNGQIINSLAQATASAIHAADDIPGLLRKIIETDAWRSYTVEMLETKVEFDNIQDWVEARSPVGLDTTVEVLMDLLRHHPDLQARVLKLIQEDN